MKWVAVFGGALLMLAGLASLSGRRNLDDWTFRIWTVPSDYDAPTWYKAASSYTVAGVIFTLGVVLIVAAVARAIVRSSGVWW